MKNYIVYDNQGRIFKVGYCPDIDFSRQAQDGENILEGIADPHFQYIENSAIVDKPPKPSDDHLFDYATKTWVIDTQGAASRAMAKRNQLLASGPDRVNPMWWSSMSAADQDEVSAYRQALLDITNQFGFPMDIEWPEIPSVFKG